MAAPPLHAGSVLPNCSVPDIAKIFNDTQGHETCHVCLSSGAVVGLAFHAQTGLISLTALLVLVYIIVRNYWRNLRNPNLGPWRLFRGNVDILMLNLIVADIVMSLGAISDIHWAKEGQVYCGSYCDAQGILQTMGEPAAALSTLSVAVYTFFTVNANRRPSYRPWVCLGVVAAIWLWVLLWSIILLVKYDDPGVSNDEKQDVLRAYTPTPWWCWINGSQRYLAIKIVAEYLWLWIAGMCTIGLYVPAYFIVRNQNGRPRQPASSIRLDADRRSLASVGSIDESNEAVKLLWYPLAYTFCVLPLSIIRWAGFIHPKLLTRPQILPATMVFSSIFNLMGLINVVLIFWTRPAILLIGSDGCLTPEDPRFEESDMEEIHLPPMSSHMPESEPQSQDQNENEPSPRRRGNGFGGAYVRVPREQF